MTCPPDAGENDKGDERGSECLTTRADEKLRRDVTISHDRIRHAAFFALLRNDYNRNRDEVALHRVIG
jgi:hypothetical protein